MCLRNVIIPLELVLIQYSTAKCSIMIASYLLTLYTVDI